MAIKCVLCGGAHTQSEHFAAIRKSVPNVPNIATPKPISVIKAVPNVPNKVPKRISEWKLKNKERYKEYMRGYMKGKREREKDIPEVPFTTA